ncbi:MAG: hypothetical protein DHS20C16_21390 [Phycisphaerae bacterium]|nr:MAG: hypothetical protein DHS20C16_21390 [Phycisphaerae bacterium]
MKHMIAIAMSFGFALSADAARLAIRFAPGDSHTVNDQNASVDIGDTVSVEVLWTFTPDDVAVNDLAGFSFNLTSVPEDPSLGIQGDRVEDPNLFVDNDIAFLPDWGTSNAPGTVGGDSNQIGGFAQFQIASLDQAGTTLVSSFDVTVTGGSIGDVRNFYIQRLPFALSPSAGDSSGSEFTLSPSPSGYDEYDIGTGFAGFNDGTGALPLTINVTPEPAAVAILALGIVFVRRTQ